MIMARAAAAAGISPFEIIVSSGLVAAAPSFHNWLAMRTAYPWHWLRRRQSDVGPDLQQVCRPWSVRCASTPGSRTDKVCVETHNRQREICVQGVGETDMNATCRAR